MVACAIERFMTGQKIAFHATKIGWLKSGHRVCWEILISSVVKTDKRRACIWYRGDFVLQPCGYVSFYPPLYLGFWVLLDLAAAEAVVDNPIPNRAARYGMAPQVKMVKFFFVPMTAWSRDLGLMPIFPEEALARAGFGSM